MGVPEGISGGRVEGFDGSTGRPGKNQITRSGKKAGVGPALPFVAPDNLAGLVIERFKRALRPASAIIATPSLRIIGAVIEIVDAESAVGVHVKQAGLRIER